MKFSIITPYYKCFDLMQDYFNSLENQTYKDFEVILIDDASKDGVISDIEKEFIRREICYTIKINETNCGPGIARNIGIEAACGDYLLFVDADDWISVDTLATLNEIIIQNPKTECLAFDYVSVTKGNETKHATITSKQLGRLTRCINTSSMAKVYRRDYILNNDIQFYPGYLAEDFYFTISAISKCNFFYYVNKNFYYYRMNDSSITHSINIERLNTVKKIIEELFSRRFINLEEKQFFILREYVYMVIRSKKGKRDLDVDECLRHYSLGEMLTCVRYLRVHQTILLLLYKFKLHKLIEIGFYLCE